MSVLPLKNIFKVSPLFHFFFPPLFFFFVGFCSDLYFSYQTKHFNIILFKILWDFSPYQCGRASITKYQRLGGLNNRNLFSQFWRPRSRCWQIWFHMNPLSVICRWRASYFLFTWLSCVCYILLFLCQNFSSYKDTSQIVAGPTLMASFLMSLLLQRAYLQIQLHLELLRVKASIYKFWGLQFSP